MTLQTDSGRALRPSGCATGVVQTTPPSVIDSAVRVPLSLPTKTMPGPTVIAPLPRTVSAGTSAL